MKKANIIPKITAMLLIIIFLAAPNISTACAFVSFRPLPPSTAATLDELMKWYENAAQLGTTSSCVLTNNIVIDRPVALGQSIRNMDIFTEKYSIIIADGGALSIDNPNFWLAGINNVITAKSGSELNVKRCAEIASQYGYAITGEQGAKITCSPGIIIKDKAAIIGNNDITKITAVFNAEQALYILEGGRKEDLRPPEMVYVTIQKADNTFYNTQLKVNWNLSELDCGKAGNYKVKGIIPSEELERAGVKNPNNLTAELIIGVQKPGPIDLKASLVKLSSNNYATVKVTVPVIPADGEAFYVYKSSDKVKWEKVYWTTPGNGELIEHDNFIKKVQEWPNKSPNQYFHCEFTVTKKPVWLKVRVVGSIYDGASNEVEIIAADGNPGPDSDDSYDEFDDSSEGTRGGGGQAVVKREPPPIAGVVEADIPKTDNHYNMSIGSNIPNNSGDYDGGESQEDSKPPENQEENKGGDSAKQNEAVMPASAKQDEKTKTKEEKQKQKTKAYAAAATASLATAGGAFGFYKLFYLKNII